MCQGTKEIGVTTTKTQMRSLGSQSKKGKRPKPKYKFSSRLVPALLHNLASSLIFAINIVRGLCWRSKIHAFRFLYDSHKRQEISLKQDS